MVCTFSLEDGQRACNTPVGYEVYGCRREKHHLVSEQHLVPVKGSCRKLERRSVIKKKKAGLFCTSHSEIKASTRLSHKSASLQQKTLTAYSLPPEFSVFTIRNVGRVAQSV